MKKKTTYYPPVERVTLPQFAKRKKTAEPAGQIAVVGRKHHETEPRSELREEILREFTAHARKLGRQ